MQVPRQRGHHLLLDDLLKLQVLRAGQTEELLVHRAQVVDRWFLVAHKHLLDRLSKDLAARRLEVERERGGLARLLLAVLLLLRRLLLLRLQRLVVS